MGVSLWEQLIEHSNTPIALAHELYGLELQRIALNMQISLAHCIARQARECAQKMAQADAIYQRRVNRHAPISLKETH